LQNSDENQSNKDSNSTKKSDTILTGSGISYAQIPRSLFKLTEIESLTYSDMFLALKLFDHCHSKSKYPNFEISISDIVKITKMSRRQVMYGIDRLNALGVFIARINVGATTEYQWNEYFLQTGYLSRIDTSANSAPVDVQSLHQCDAELAPVLVQNLHGIYIEFILDYLSKLYLEYFASSESLVKRVPPKRGQKGVAKDFATHYYISRRDGWTEAIEASIKFGGYVRTYVALAGGFDIKKVAFPKAYLKKLIWDESHQYESKKNSHIAKNGTLDSDEIFLKWIEARHNRGKNTEEIENNLAGLKVELTYMSESDDSGEERYE
jgi:hypothetical protein